MTKRTMFTGMLVGLALLASSVVAHAGGGGFGGGPLTSVFLTDCYQMVPSVNIPYTLELIDQFGDHKNVKVGQAALLCAGSSSWRRDLVSSPNQPPINPSFDSTSVNAVKCYQVTAPGDEGAATTSTVTDIFTTHTVSLQRLSMVCVPATMQ
jgi:hypothetical protein